ncbi:MAG: divergent polysaccharide deacetylase family protein [Gammaproteobacteria bacterium]|nr:divergent polysaccharide deacetylase family protein [Gammaproteobacteria bacterium]
MARIILIVGILLGLALPVVAQERVAQISIIIDDLGDQWRNGLRAINLPGQITYAILPHTPYSVRLAHKAHDAGREVMLHFPMASSHRLRPGPGAVDVSMSQVNFRAQARDNLAAVPFIRGVNNHMGSQVTPSMKHMAWLMEDLALRGDLFFVDSMTIGTSVAGISAQEKGIPMARRDVFLDHHRDAVKIHKQFQRLLKLAKRRGYAVAIGHPYPETLAMLEAELPKLTAQGIELVAVSTLIQTHRQQGPILWQASLSPSPVASKN